MNNDEQEKELVRESLFLSIVLFIYGIFMFILGIFTGKNKAEADILGKIIDRSKELEEERKEVCPFDENLSEKEASEYYDNLPEEEKEKFEKKLDEWYITVQKQKELLTFADKI